MPDQSPPGTHSPRERNPASLLCTNRQSEAQGRLLTLDVGHGSHTGRRRGMIAK